MLVWLLDVKCCLRKTLEGEIYPETDQLVFSTHEKKKGHKNALIPLEVMVDKADILP